MSPHSMNRSSQRTRPLTPWSEFFDHHLYEVPIVAVLRGMDPEAAVEFACAAWDAGVRLVEVTLERQGAAESLQAVVEAAPEGTPVGAGTVTTPQRLELALQRGAAFAIAPGLDLATVECAQQHNVPFLPGIATPSEAGHALRLGITSVKAFPAAALGTQWIAALADPFPELRVIATGGINAANAATFLAAGAVGVGLGSSLRKDGPHDVVAAVRRPVDHASAGE